MARPVLLAVLRLFSVFLLSGRGFTELSHIRNLFYASGPRMSTQPSRIYAFPPSLPQEHVVPPIA